MTVESQTALERTQSRAVAPDRAAGWAVVVIAVVASVGLLPWIGGSMFADEGATLYSAHLSWSNLWAQSTHVDLVLLPYYVLVHGWIAISGNIAWVRALSLLAYFGTIVVVGWAGLRLAGRWCGVGAAVLTATSTILVEKALNARPYELSTFLVALCAVALFRWLHDARGQWLWMFSGLSLLVAAMQLFSLLAPVSMLLCVVVVRPALIRDRVRALIAPVGVLAVVSLAWVVACAGELGQVNWIAGESTASRLFEEIRGPAIGQLYDLALFVIVATVVFKLAAVWTPDVRNAVTRDVRQQRDALAVMVGWALVPTVLLALASFVHPIYSVRYVAASAPGLALLVSFVFVRAFPSTFSRSRHPESTGQRPPNRVVGAVCAIAAVLLVIGYIASASGLQEDLESPARYVAAHVEPGDVLALPDHAITAAFTYYLADDARRVALWPQLGVRQRYVEGFDLALRPSGRWPRRIWLLDDGTVAGVSQFATVLHDRGYKIVEQKGFRGSTLFVFHATEPVTSVRAPSNRATVRGTKVALAAGASSYGVAISRVQFLLSGGSLSKTVIGRAVPTLLGYYFIWNSTTVPNGTYSLQSVATNKIGKRTESPAITIKVDN